MAVRFQIEMALAPERLNSIMTDDTTEMYNPFPAENAIWTKPGAAKHPETFLGMVCVNPGNSHTPKVPPRKSMLTTPKGI